jgi:transaldolase
MSTVVQTNPTLKSLSDAGVSVWHDGISRSFVADGELERMVGELCVRGVTTSPSIFEKAIFGSDAYAQELQALARDRLDALAIYDRLAIRDVQIAADVLAGAHREAAGRDGFVSLEVAPDIAHDAQKTIEAARAYWQQVDRTNVMIKIPGTPAGAQAIEQATYEGINVNVTLLFAVDAYEGVADAYIRGLERRQADGLPLEVYSVASFFISRVDTNVDRRLADLGRTDLSGKAALANARDAHGRFKQIFSGPRWEGLLRAGASVQRPLWASTGTKDPRYSDVIYVEELVAPNTVSTIPVATLLAVADHGRVSGATADQDPSADLAALADAGIDMREVTAELLDDGLEQFQQAMDRLIAGIESKRAAYVDGNANDER